MTTQENMRATVVAKTVLILAVFHVLFVLVAQSFKNIVNRAAGCLLWWNVNK